MLFPLQKFAMVTSKSVTKNIATAITVATLRSFENVSAILFTFFAYKYQVTTDLF